MIEARVWRSMSNREVLDSLEVAVDVLRGRALSGEELARLAYIVFSISGILVSKFPVRGHE